MKSPKFTMNKDADKWLKKTFFFPFTFVTFSFSFLFGNLLYFAMDTSCSVDKEYYFFF